MEGVIAFHNLFVIEKDDVGGVIAFDRDPP
jgi:hypothetical protein